MIGLTNISEKILSDARLRAQAIVDEAQATADEILAEAQKKTKKETEEFEKACVDKAEDIQEKARLSTQLDCKKLVSTQRQELISSVYDNTLKKLLELPEEEYMALLLKLCKDVFAVEEMEGCEILLNSRDKKAYGQKLVANFSGVTLAPKSAPIVGGIVVRKGKIEYNCALDVIVASVSEELSAKVAGALFSN